MVRNFNFGPVVAFVVLSAALAVGATSYAQSGGALSGQVIDGAGVGVAGAKITVVSQGDQPLTLETETDDDGNYRVIGLRGNSRYEIRAEKEGVGIDVAAFRMKTGQYLVVDLDLSAAAAAAIAALSEEELAEIKRGDDMEASFELGVNASNAGDYREAIIQFQIAIANSDSCHDCYQNLGLAYTELEDYDRAETAFKQAIAFEADFAAAYTGLANIYNTQRRFDEAAEASAEAVRLSGSALGGATDSLAVYNQGIILWNAQKFGEAKVQFEQTIQLDPNHAEAHYFLAMTSLNQGNMADAAVALEKYIELAPNGQYVDQARGMLPQLQQ